MPQSASSAPYLPDLEFFARMLGVSVGGLANPPPGFGVSEAAYTMRLARRIVAAADDPIANARAQYRIAALRAELPIPYPDGYYGPVHAERFDSCHVLLS